jgi:succinate dehydrogenase/fumarate reductase flavoprotein subunit
MRREDLPRASVPAEAAYNTSRSEWFELRLALLTAEAVARAALAREESRGAHQREDFADTSPELATSRLVGLRGGAVALA